MFNFFISKFCDQQSITRPTDVNEAAAPLVEQFLKKITESSFGQVAARTGKKLEAGQTNAEAVAGEGYNGGDDDEIYDDAEEDADEYDDADENEDDDEDDEEDDDEEDECEEVEDDDGNIIFVQSLSQLAKKTLFSQTDDRKLSKQSPSAAQTSSTTATSTSSNATSTTASREQDKQPDGNEESAEVVVTPNKPNATVAAASPTTAAASESSANTSERPKQTAVRTLPAKISPTTAPKAAKTTAANLEDLQRKLQERETISGNPYKPVSDNADATSGIGKIFRKLAFRINMILAKLNAICIGLK